MQPSYPQPVPPMPAPPAYPQPQAYPPAPQQYAPPQAPAYPPQQFAPPAHVLTQREAPAAPATGQPLDEFGAPAPILGNIPRPRIMDLDVGRLVLFRPTKIERDIPAPPRAGEAPRKQDRVTVDVIPLDGQPFGYGGKPERMVPHTHVGNPGDFFPGCWISNKILVAQLERSVDPAGRLMVLGRLTKVQGADLNNNPSWRLTDPTEADRQLAREWKARFDAGQIPAAGGVAAPAQVAPQPYAPIPAQLPPPQQPQYAPPPAPPVYAPPAPVQIACPPGIDPAWFAAQTPDAQAYYAQQAQPQPGQPAQWS